MQVQLLESVLEVLNGASMRPAELVDRLRERADEPSVRAALWRLIDQGRVDVTREGRVQAIA